MGKKWDFRWSEILTRNPSRKTWLGSPKSVSYPAQGFIRIVGFEAELEDKIAALLGGTIPFVLRPYVGGYRLVNEQ